MYILILGDVINQWEKPLRFIGQLSPNVLHNPYGILLLHISYMPNTIHSL
jgi:hypothetical protein